MKTLEMINKVFQSYETIESYSNALLDILRCQKKVSLFFEGDRAITREFYEEFFVTIPIKTAYEDPDLHKFIQFVCLNHELGHVAFTDFKLADLEFNDSYKFCFNIIEDLRVEYVLSKELPYFYKFFQMAMELLVFDQLTKNIESIFNLENFCNYASHRFYKIPFKPTDVTDRFEVIFQMYQEHIFSYNTKLSYKKIKSLFTNFINGREKNRNK